MLMGHISPPSSPTQASSITTALHQSPIPHSTHTVPFSPAPLSTITTSTSWAARRRLSIDAQSKRELRLFIFSPCTEPSLHLLFDFLYLHFQHLLSCLSCLSSHLVYTSLQAPTRRSGFWVVICLFLFPSASLFCPDRTEQTSVGYFMTHRILRRSGDELFVSALQRLGASFFCPFLLEFL